MYMLTLLFNILHKIAKTISEKETLMMDIDNVTDIRIALTVYEYSANSITKIEILKNVDRWELGITDLHQIYQTDIANIHTPYDIPNALQKIKKFYHI